MEKYDLVALAVSIWDGTYRINKLTTYTGLRTLADCYKQLKLWSESKNYRYKILSYTIKKNGVMVKERDTTNLGISLPKSRTEFDSWLERDIETYNSLIKQEEEKETE